MFQIKGGGAESALRAQPAHIPMSLSATGTTVDLSLAVQDAVAARVSGGEDPHDALSVDVSDVLGAD